MCSRGKSYCICGISFGGIVLDEIIPVVRDDLHEVISVVISRSKVGENFLSCLPLITYVLPFHFYISVSLLSSGCQMVAK